MADNSNAQASRRRHRDGGDHLAGQLAREFWDGVSNGRVAIRNVAHMSMDGYRTSLGGEVQDPAAPEHSYLNPDGFHDRAIDFTIKAAEEAMANCGVQVGPIPAERWGVVIGTCNAGLLAGRGVARAAQAGRAAGPPAGAAGPAAGDRGGPQRRLRPARPGAVGRHRVRGQRQRDRVCRRADPQRPGRRRADRRRGRLLGHPLRRASTRWSRSRRSPRRRIRAIAKDSRWARAAACWC